jgi:hypothetical protein
MIEIKDCLPEVARKHFIDLRNIHLQAETARYQQRLTQLRAQLAAKGQGRSGWQAMEEWKYKEELSNALATGYVQDAIDTCDLYETPLKEWQTMLQSHGPVQSDPHSRSVDFSQTRYAGAFAMLRVPPRSPSQNKSRGQILGFASCARQDGLHPRGLRV